MPVHHESPRHASPRHASPATRAWGLRASSAALALVLAACVALPAIVSTQVRPASGDETPSSAPAVVAVDQAGSPSMVGDAPASEKTTTPASTGADALSGSTAPAAEAGIASGQGGADPVGGTTGAGAGAFGAGEAVPSVDDGSAVAGAAGSGSGTPEAGDSASGSSGTGPDAATGSDVAGQPSGTDGQTDAGAGSGATSDEGASGGASGGAGEGAGDGSVTTPAEGQDPAAGVTPDSDLAAGATPCASAATDPDAGDGEGAEVTSPGPEPVPESLTITKDFTASGLVIHADGDIIRSADNIAFRLGCAAGTIWVQANRFDDGSWGATVPFSSLGASPSVEVATWHSVAGVTEQGLVKTMDLARASATLDATWDPASFSVAVRATDVDGMGGVTNVAMRLVTPTGAVTWIALDDRGDGEWATGFSPADYGWAQGRYGIDVYVGTRSAGAVVAARGEVDVDLSDVLGTESYTYRVSHDLIGLEFAASGGRIDLATNVAFNVQVQDRSIWIAATHAEDGSWAATYPASGLGSSVIKVSTWASLPGGTIAVDQGSLTVPAASCTASYSWDDSALLMRVDVSDAVIPGGVNNVALMVVSPSGSVRWVAAGLDASGSWHAALSPQVFSWEKGDYRVSVYVGSKAGGASVASSGKVTVQLDDVFGAEKTMTSVDYDSGILTITASGGRFPYAGNVAFQVATSGFNAWYGAARDDEGRWVTTIPLGVLPRTGSYTIASWMTYDGVTSAVGSASFIKSAASCVVEAQADYETLSMPVVVSGVSCMYDVRNIALRIVAPGGSTVWTDTAQGEDGSWNAAIDPASFGWQGGSYAVDVYVGTSQGAYLAGSTSVIFSMQVTHGLEDVFSYQEGDGDTLKVMARGGRITGATNVAFQLSGTRSQWFAASRAEDGSWTAYIPSSSVYGAGRFELVVWATCGGVTSAITQAPVWVAKQNTVVVAADGTGDYTSLTAALWYTSGDVIVRPGEYDVVSEYRALFGDNLFSTMTNDTLSMRGFQYGLYVNERSVFFEDGAHVTCDMASRPAYDTFKFSAFHLGTNAVIDNLDCAASYAYYVIHDDPWSVYAPYTNVIRNCDLRGLDLYSGNCIGGGACASSKTVVEGCTLKRVATVEGPDEAVIRYHNTYLSNGTPVVVVKDSTIEGELHFNYFGPTSSTMTAIAYNNNVSAGISKHPEIPGNTDNVNIFAWNNKA